MIFPSRPNVSSIAFMLGLAASTPQSGASDSAELTVYSGDYDALAERGTQDAGYALIAQTLSRRLEAGIDELALSGLPHALDVASVGLRTPDTVRLLSQRYEFALADQSALLRRALGRTVTVEYPLGEQVRRDTGQLIAAGNGLTVRLPDGRVKILARYASIELAEPPAGVVDAATLRWRLESERAQTAELRLEYATAGLAWRAEYQLRLEPDAGRGLRLDAVAQVVNRSGTTFRDARLTLIAGEPNRIRSIGPAQGRGAGEMNMMAFSADAETPTPETSSEYHAYPLPGTVELPDESIQRLPLLARAEAVPCLRRYRVGTLWNQPPGRPIAQREFGNTGEQTVRVGLELRNEKSAGLGLALPAGRVRVLEADGAFLGEALLGHTPGGAEIELDLGRSFDLRGERTPLDFRLDRDQRTIVERIRWTLRNSKTTPAAVRVDEGLPRWSDWDIIEAERPWSKTDGQNIAFEVELPAEGEIAFAYTVRYRWSADVRIP